MLFYAIATVFQLYHGGINCCMNYCHAEKLASVRVEAPEVTQSEVGQKQKLRVVLDMVSKILQLPPSWNQHKWNVDSKCLF